VLSVIAERPGATVSEIAELTGIPKPLVYHTTRAGVERGELERVALPGGLSGFRPAHASTQPPTSPE
jgi:DNA-binding IclR family transcriptional regulator